MHWDPRAVLLIKLAHVLLAAVWLGGNVYYNLLVLPTLARATAATRAEFQRLVTPWSFKVANAVGGSTILTGLLYLYALQDGLGVEGRWARLVAAGAMAAVTALVLLNFSIRPATKALARLRAKDAPDTPPSQHAVLLMHKVAFSSRMCLVLLVAAFATMVWAASLSSF